MYLRILGVNKISLPLFGLLLLNMSIRLFRAKQDILRRSVKPMRKLEAH